jgi:cytochrome c oxidase cbb3-type subunit 2
MNRAVWLYVGALLTVVASFLGLVGLPQHQLGALTPVKDDSGNQLPLAPEGAVAAGRGVYLGLGCMYCHSQQVRPQGFGADLERGWGSRRTVARDHIWDNPPVLGTMRTGPDLANIAARQPSQSWHLLHLFNPRLTSPGSTMPAFPFLFVRQRVEVERPGTALSFPPGLEPAGLVVLPNGDATSLVAYLLSLDHGYPVPEAR